MKEVKHMQSKSDGTKDMKQMQIRQTATASRQLDTQRALLDETILQTEA